MKLLALFAAILALTATGQFHTKTSGLCAIPIVDVSECQLAFNTLGLALSVGLSDFPETLPPLPAGTVEVPDINELREHLGDINDLLPSQDIDAVLPDVINVPGKVDLSKTGSVKVPVLDTFAVSVAALPRGCLSLSGGLSSVLNTNAGQGILPADMNDLLPVSFESPQISDVLDAMGLLDLLPAELHNLVPLPTALNARKLIPKSADDELPTDLNDLLDPVDLPDLGVDLADLINNATGVDVTTPIRDVPGLQQAAVCSNLTECVCRSLTDDNRDSVRDRRVRFRTIMNMPSDTNKRQAIGVSIASDLQTELRKTFPKLVASFVAWTFVALKPKQQRRRLLSTPRAEYDAEFDFTSTSAQTSDTTAHDAAVTVRELLANDAPAMSAMIQTAAQKVDSTIEVDVDTQQATVERVDGGDINSSKTDDSGLSGGVIAGITAGVVFAVALVAVLIFMHNRNKTVRNNKEHSQAVATSTSVEVQVEQVRVADQGVEVFVGGKASRLSISQSVSK